MNVELTIQAMYDYYPTLFKERADCLNQLFVVLGSGYKWRNGELISSDDRYKKEEIEILKSHLVDGKAFQHNKFSLRDETIYYDKLRKEDPYYKDPLKSIYTDEEIEEMHQRHINSLPDDVYYKEPLRRHRWYCCQTWPDGKEHIQWCEEYIPLLNIPEDIKPDWLEALNETKALLIENGLIYSGWEENEK